MGRFLKRISVFIISIMALGCASIEKESDFFCEAIPNDPHFDASGPEDVVFDRARNLVYVSMTEGQSGIYYSSYTPNSDSSLGSDPVFTPFSKTTLHSHTRTHGIDIYKDNLFVVDHITDRSDAIFVYSLKTGKPDIEGRYLVDSINFGINDLAILPMDKGSICVNATVNHGQIIGRKGKLMTATLPKKGPSLESPDSIRLLDTHVNGKFGNGVAYDPLRDETYVAFSRDKEIRIFRGNLCQPNDAGDSPEPLKTIKVHGLPDNLSWNLDDKSLYVAVHKSQLRFAFGKYFSTWSQFYRIDPDNNYKLTELVLHDLDGRGSSVVTPITPNHLLVGSVYGNSVFSCKTH